MFRAIVRDEEAKIHSDYSPADPDINIEESASIYSVIQNGIEIIRKLGKWEIERLEELAIEHQGDVENELIARLEDYNETGVTA